MAYSKMLVSRTYRSIFLELASINQKVDGLLAPDNTPPDRNESRPAADAARLIADSFPADVRWPHAVHAKEGETEPTLLPAPSVPPPTRRRPVAVPAA